MTRRLMRIKGFNLFHPREDEVGDAGYTSVHMVDRLFADRTYLDLTRGPFLI